MNSDFDSYVQGFFTGAIVVAIIASLVIGVPVWTFVMLGLVLFTLIIGEIL